MELKPSAILERVLNTAEDVFNNEDLPHWLMFGGLWGMIINRGIVPDGDLDFCSYYPGEWERLSKAMKSVGYSTRKVLLSDIDTSKALYMGFDGPDDVHICLSFWVKWKNFYFWCHDQNGEVLGGEAVPVKQGYFFKGCPAELIEGEEKFIMAEWPGIPPKTKVRVPVLAGQLLDWCYPGWMYLKQRYTVHNYQINDERCVSVNNVKFNKNANHLAESPYMVNVRSIADFGDEAKILASLDASKQKWFEDLKKRFKR